MKETTGIGVVGCGDISGIYLENCRRFSGVEVVACADLDRARAEARATEFGVPKVLGTEELFAASEVEIVLNLTTPETHVPVGLAALKAGKHVYSEKPLALSVAEGRKLLEAARSRGLRVGCAPDTFLGAGIQTAAKLVNDGAIGEPVAGTAFMACHGHESWHPSPDFYYRPGGGPLFDMGPYYLTALCVLLGPVRRVSGSVSTSASERRVERGPYAGRRVAVETPTHTTAVLDFASGATVTWIGSFDVWAHTLPHLELHGSAGSLSVPDPNTFGGPVGLWEPEAETWRDVPLAFPHETNSRGLGLAELAAAIREGRPHRASAELAFHVLEVMEAVYESSRSGRHLSIRSEMTPPAPLPPDLAEGVFCR